MARLVVRLCLSLAVCLVALAEFSDAQVDPSAGILPFSTHLAGQYDSIDPASGNIMISIPIMSKAGKIPFSFSLVGNYHAFDYGNMMVVPNTGLNGGGLNGVPSAGLSSNLNYTTTFTLCGQVLDQATSGNFTLLDASGAGHSFGGSFTYGPCNVSAGFTEPASDASRYSLVVTPNGEYPPTLAVYDRSGNSVPTGNPGDGLTRYTYGDR